jgi:uncharacterized protein YbjT (DUF2867 family)
MTSVQVSVKDLVLVAGATGGVGQLVTGKLLEKGVPVRVLTRDAAKATKMFNGRVEIAVGDIDGNLTPLLTLLNGELLCLTLNLVNLGLKIIPPRLMLKVSST